MNATQNTITTQQAAAPAKSAMQPRKRQRMARQAAAPGEARPSNPASPAAPSSTRPASAQPAGTKSAAVIALLSRPDGATDAEIIDATG